MTRRLFKDLRPRAEWARLPAVGGAPVRKSITWTAEPDPEDWDKDRYCTPPEALIPVYEMFELRGGIGLDPCSDSDSIVEAKVCIEVLEGGCGLRDSWADALRDHTTDEGALIHPPTVFYNPPYSAIGPWTGKASIETATHGPLETVGLFPPHVDTVWWDETVWRTAASVCFVRGRYRFLRQGVVEPNPRYASAFVLHVGLNVNLVEPQQRFEAAFAKVGQVIHNVDGRWGTSVSKSKGFYT